MMMAEREREREGERENGPAQLSQKIGILEKPEVRAIKV